MRKALLLSVVAALITVLGFSQSDKNWKPYTGNVSTITTDKAVARKTFPKVFKLYELNTNVLRQQLFTIVGNQTSHTTIITLPNVNGQLEQFEVVEASNFEPALQAQFPNIRAFSGKGITDKSASLKLSIAPNGIQTMVFRTEKESEFIEAYSKDHNIYAVFNSQRQIGQLSWTCSTDEQREFSSLKSKISATNRPSANNGQLKTMRLAQSCNAEYSNYFGAFNSSQVGLVLAAYNATLTRCNGVYEKDLALHLNLVASSTNVIFYDPATDPYSANLNQWNTQLQQTLNTTLTGVGTTLADNNAAYDVGHMFGASGGGGNAGCIGCVCVDGVASGNGATKGRGITSPADGIPQGDNFDIDYVVHEIGHQLGALHTFSFDAAQIGAASVEVASGITIMGYAGIVAGANAAAHSVDYYHEFSIDQIQANLATKTCPITTVITPNNATPVVAPVSAATIPISTPFALTGTATDANAADVLTYCWEQTDAATSSAGNGVASATKTSGPNFLSFPVRTNGTRLFPRLESILTGASTTSGTINAGNNINIEALSSVARILNFRLTVRDNSPYSSTAPIKVGQTALTDVAITVSSAVGPFLITSQNSSISYVGGSTQTVTWSVNGTTGAPTNTANVRISWSADGGNTFSTLIASTPNDGTEDIVIPVGVTSTGRIRVEAIGNIYFDINNANITVTVPPNGFTFGATTPTTSACPAAATLSVTIPTTVTGTFATPINLTSTGAPTGTTITFAPNPVTPGNSTIATLNNANTLPAGTYNVTVTGTAGAVVNTTTISFVINPGAAPVITTQPANVTVCAPATATFTVATSTPGVTYQWQTAPTATGTFTNITGATLASYTTGPSTGLNGRAYRVIVSTQCGTITSNVAVLTENSVASITTQPVDVTVCQNTTATFTVQGAGTGVTYQWQQSTAAAGPFVNVSTGTGGTTNAYTTATTTPADNNTFYRVQLTTACGGAITSNVVRLTVNTVASITAQPTAQTACVPNTASFSVTAVGTGLSYQWQISTNGGTSFTDISGATATTYTTPATTLTFNNNQYRVNILSTCSPTVPVTSNAVVLSVNNPVVVTANPVSQRGCSGDNFTFSVAATGGTLSYQWQVSTNGGTTFTNVIPGVPANPATSGTQASYTINNASLLLNGNLYRVIVSGIPCGVVTTPAVPLVLSNRPAIVLTAAQASSLNPSINSGLYTTVSPVGSYSYVWLKNGSVISNTNSSLPINVDAFGTYQVSITDPISNCVSLSNIVKIDSLVSNQLFIYPNPVSSNMQVRYYSATTTTRNATINVYDAKGARVFSKSYTVTGTYGRMDVDMSRMQQGTYLVELRDASGKKLATGKAVKGL